MRTLTLSLKKKWFDMIKSGEKKEEYRECSLYWIKRFEKLCKNFEYLHIGRHSRIVPTIVMEKADGLKCDTLIFTLGYPKADDMERRLKFKNPKFRIDKGRPEWGAEHGKMYFVISWEE